MSCAFYPFPGATEFSLDQLHRKREGAAVEILISLGTAN